MSLQPLETRVIEAPNFTALQIASALLRHSGVDKIPQPDGPESVHIPHITSLSDTIPPISKEPCLVITEPHRWPSAAASIARVYELGGGKFKLERYQGQYNHRDFPRETFPSGQTLETFNPADYSLNSV